MLINNISSVKKIFRTSLSGIDIESFKYNFTRYNKYFNIFTVKHKSNQERVNNTSFSITGEYKYYEDDGFDMRKVVFKGNSIFPYCFYMFKFIPSRFEFQIIAHKKPFRIKKWFEKYTPMFLLNGGYFEDDYNSSGILKSKNMTCLYKKQNLKGMICLKDQSVHMDWVENIDHDSLDDYNFALQSGPFLIEPNQKDGIFSDDRKKERRTIISQDRRGNVVFFVFPMKVLSLYQSMQFVKHYDMRVSLNLDGGTSTGFYLSFSNSSYHMPSIRQVPNIIAVYKKQ